MKERLARTGDISADAMAVRLKAARMVAGYRVQKEFAELCGMKPQNYNNIEKGKQAPNVTLLKMLYRSFRIDFNFMIYGMFSQLPQDVQTSLFRELESLSSESGQTEGSGRNRATPTPAPQS